MAKAMVTQYGMSEEMGPLAYGENEQEVFLGHSVARQQNMSEETQCKIDAEVRRLVEEGYEQAKPSARKKWMICTLLPRVCWNMKRLRAMRLPACSTAHRLSAMTRTILPVPAGQLRPSRKWVGQVVNLEAQNRKERDGLAQHDRAPSAHIRYC